MNHAKKMQSQSAIREALFSGERLLVLVGLLGMALAAGTAVCIGLLGAEVPPEGNLESVFSFNAAIGIFVLSIAAILPLTGWSPARRTRVRYWLAAASVYAYAQETVQHFRGINPRFSAAGTAIDRIFGIFFAVDSLLLIILTVMIAIPFFRRKQAFRRASLVLGIRYAMISTMIAYAAGIGMIVLQGRYTGDGGNLIVLHGIGFHALQTLPLIGWLTERSQLEEKQGRRFVHAGSIAWLAANLLIGWQTALGRTVFEWSPLPIASASLLLVWLAVAALAALGLRKPQVSQPPVSSSS
ncbi:hypothetical protein [Paenibacillus ginsengihumi]|uniref:hypothetical protein n=1 Tax=Paenibacillus ginsengihumi TaxID=431596 RepID=UPI00036A493C|nr:hypothetical protein [Paenibacillus ginsengihumi]